MANNVYYLDTISNEIKTAVNHSIEIRGVGTRLEIIFTENGHKFPDDTLSDFKKRADMYVTIGDLINSNLCSEYHVRINNYIYFHYYIN
jgi:hypothetical protein